MKVILLPVINERGRLYGQEIVREVQRRTQEKLVLHAASFCSPTPKSPRAAELIRLNGEIRKCEQNTVNVRLKRNVGDQKTSHILMTTHPSTEITITGSRKMSLVGSSPFSRVC